jgi:hypothetical protein
MLLITALCILYFVLLVFFGWNSDTVIYWLATSGEWVWELALPLFFAWVAYFILTLILHRDTTEAVFRHYAARIVILSFITSLVLCGTNFVAFWHRGLLGYREHVGTVHLATYTYHLQFYSPDAVERYSHRYELYECLLNLLCKVIYTAYVDNGKAPSIKQIELVPDTAVNAILVQINGSIAFTHQP